MNQRPVLALETSTRTSTVALGFANGEVTEVALDPTHPRASDLAPLAAECLERAGLEPGDLCGIAVGTGPGSFTGLRVAAAFALGLEASLGVPLLGVPSFTALLSEARGESEPFEALVLGDARASRLYAAHYRVGNDVDCLRAPEAPELAEFAAWLASSTFRHRLRIWADTSALEREVAGATVLDALRAQTGAFELVGPIRPTARGVLAIAAERLRNGERTRPAELRPLYLSRFGQGG